MEEPTLGAQQGDLLLLQLMTTMLQLMSMVSLVFIYIFCSVIDEIKFVMWEKISFLLFGMIDILATKWAAYISWLDSP